MALAKAWILDKMPSGVPSEENFKLVTEELLYPNDGGKAIKPNSLQ
jgi:hypothetical protein